MKIDGIEITKKKRINDFEILRIAPDFPDTLYIEHGILPIAIPYVHSYTSSTEIQSVPKNPPDYIR